MSRTYRQHSSCSPSNQKDSYIYAIVPIVDGGVAAITSGNELLAVDARTLQATSTVRFQNLPDKLTSLVPADDGRSIVCAGSSGAIAIFDVRSQRKASTFKSERGITALACRNHDVAFGTELAHQQAIVGVWDVRQTQVRWQNSENNDDITTVNFHPQKDNLILSGGDDGLVSLFDTSIVEEDESLLQAVNHGPIHKAGFFGDSGIYALSSDQNLALHPVYIEGRDTEPAPVLLGDLRPIIPCEYVIDLFSSEGDMVVASGSHSAGQADLLPLKSDGRLDLTHRIILEGAHGEAIVRSIFSDNQNGTIFTAGEDGQIKAFRPVEEKEPTTASVKGSKVKKGADSRFRPY